MNETKNLELLSFGAENVVRKAANYIQSQFGLFRTSMAEEKSYNSLVTEVDRTSENILVNGLQSLLPGATFLTEEETIPSLSTSMRWIIDPLDGTTNFLFEVPIFAVSIALEIEGRLELGIVHDVMNNDHFSAWSKGGAWKNGKPIKVSTHSELAQCLLATGFPYYDYDQSKAYLDVLASFMEKTRGIRRFGSAALDLAWTACGRFDAFYEYGLYPWDVAGGAVLVREAGGLVIDFQGGDNYLEEKTLIAGNKMITSLVQKEISLYF